MPAPPDAGPAEHGPGGVPAEPTAAPDEIDGAATKARDAQEAAVDRSMHNNSAHADPSSDVDAAATEASAAPEAVADASPPDDATSAETPSDAEPALAAATGADSALEAGGDPSMADDAAHAEAAAGDEHAGAAAAQAAIGAETGDDPEAPHDAVANGAPSDGALAATPETSVDPSSPEPPTAADPALFAHALRIAEALVFASDRPVPPARLQPALPPGCDARAVLTALLAATADRPAPLVEVAGGFAFRTAPDLAPAITRVVEVPRRLPRAAMETLAIVAYHQPVTRAEIEEIRGASLSQTTLESLLDAALIAPRGRKEVPGRPSLWGTTPRFLEQFGLKALTDLPRREELVNEPTLPLGAPPSQPGARRAHDAAPGPARQDAPPEPSDAAPLPGA